MLHIRQKIPALRNDEVAYTIVNTSDYNGNLNQHPSIIDNPELFEVVDEEIPEFYQILNYI